MLLCTTGGVDTLYYHTTSGTEQLASLSRAAEGGNTGCPLEYLKTRILIAEVEVPDHQLLLLLLKPPHHYTGKKGGNTGCP
jgi:hypothetical protein